MVEKRTGKKPIIYSGAVFYHTNLAGYFNEYPWWVAHYYQRRPDNDGMAWRFWQHSDRGQVDGINGRWILMCLMAQRRSCRDSLMGLKKRLK